ncbi:ATP-binding protein [Pseudonocardia xishanensis]|uniref:ATP-binding protein n=1 Tax=Pseudonocardia xishanensis TaxID=630995 RepID=A0ABP8RXI4_9PSEU
MTDVHTRPDVVGRAGELARIGSAVADAAAGRGGLLLVAEEPGIGETTLLGVAADRARAAGFDAVRCR